MELSKRQEVLGVLEIKNVVQQCLSAITAEFPNRNSLQFAIFRIRWKIMGDFPQQAINKTIVCHFT